MLLKAKLSMAIAMYLLDHVATHIISILLSDARPKQEAYWTGIHDLNIENKYEADDFKGPVCNTILFV